MVVVATMMLTEMKGTKEEGR
ncbi:uncharacterized protein G2W53_028400 [Senna tora]|uniref:Uncharacterized protein n=1 Tax=Senna tora TaxID=362788 RepID=A0A834WCU0_9FABA|nr:uncharacterized protein G2W53_028400 [Senna tora]